MGIASFPPSDDNDDNFETKKGSGVPRPRLAHYSEGDEYLPTANSPDSRLVQRSSDTAPRRVVDLRKFAVDGSVCLADFTGLMGVYACLSYCWGDLNPCTTTLATINDFKKRTFHGL